MSCVCHAFASVLCCLVGTCLWLSFVMFNCGFVTFLFGVLGQMWYLIVLIPALCHLSYSYLICVSFCINAVILLTIWDIANKIHSIARVHVYT